MTKTYLISKELLQQVLDALKACLKEGEVTLQQYDASQVLKVILASPPAEPVAWMYKDEWGYSSIQSVKADHCNPVPLFRKDL